MKILYKTLAVLIAAAVIYAAVLAYFVRSFDPMTRVTYDGLGRVLTQPPVWAQLFLTEEPAWAGAMWLFVDMVWFWTGLGIAFFLFSQRSDK